MKRCFCLLGLVGLALSGNADPVPFIAGATNYLIVPSPAPKSFRREREDFSVPVLRPTFPPRVGGQLVMRWDQNPPQPRIAPFTNDVAGLIEPPKPFLPVAPGVIPDPLKLGTPSTAPSNPLLTTPKPLAAKEKASPVRPQAPSPSGAGGYLGGGEKTAAGRSPAGQPK